MKKVEPKNTSRNEAFKLWMDALMWAAWAKE